MSIQMLQERICGARCLQRNIRCTTVTLPHHNLDEGGIPDTADCNNELHCPKKETHWNTQYYLHYLEGQQTMSLN